MSDDDGIIMFLNEDYVHPRKPKSFLKRLFCRHEFRRIPTLGDYLTDKACPKCGEIKKSTDKLKLI